VRIARPVRRGGPGKRPGENPEPRPGSTPYCRRPATRCDLDHTIPYDQGGRTCECNLAPLCRRHHQAKQAPGWQLDQCEPGRMTWRLPNGRVYQTTGDPY
jgi:HNH endonuclease